MRKLALLAAAALAATGLSSAAGAAVLGPTCGGASGNTNSLPIPNPDAINCVGYFDANVISGNAGDVATQQTAVNQLLATVGLGPITLDWNALSTTHWTLLDNDGSTPNPGLTSGALNFSTPLSGYTVVSSHFGNITGPTGNVTVFWLLNLPAGTTSIPLDPNTGWSNGVLYFTGGAPLPEPATWAMMLLGFGAVGFAMRRDRRKAVLTQIA
jgi:hypothetical protein